MMLRLRQLRDALADSFWFVPLSMALAAGAAAMGSISLDHRLGERWVESIAWIWSGGADGARSVLSVVAGSVMTVVSIVFSLTVTTLAQTSAHYGPRVLRNFTSNRFVQFTLGIFLATFVYCLLVLRTVRSVEESPFVPYLSVNAGIALALASLGVLIFFLHHVAQSIQAATLVAGIGEELERALPTLFPETVGHDAPAGAQALPSIDWARAGIVRAPRSGYVLGVDESRLMALAVERDLVVDLTVRPGTFVARDTPVARFHRDGGAASDPGEELAGCFTFGRQRTPHQDVLYIAEQLVEVATHALSSGISEPLTALACVDWLGAALRGIAARELPARVRAGEDGRPRVIAPALDYEQVLRTCFDPIRHLGAANPEVLLRLLHVLEALAPALRRDADRAAVMRQVNRVIEDGHAIANQDDCRRVVEAGHAALRALARDQ